jgi:hypothetical protein
VDVEDTQQPAGCAKENWTSFHISLPELFEFYAFAFTASMEKQINFSLIPALSQSARGLAHSKTLRIHRAASNL